MGYSKGFLQGQSPALVFPRHRATSAVLGTSAALPVSVLYFANLVDIFHPQASTDAAEWASLFEKHGRYGDLDPELVQ